LKDECTQEKEFASELGNRKLCRNGYYQTYSEKVDCTSLNRNIFVKKCGTSPITGYCLAMYECESERCNIPDKSFNTPINR